MSQDYIKLLEDCVDRKNKRISEFISFLKAHEQWEADFIGEDSMWWPHGENGDVLKGKLYESFLELQSKRNYLLNSEQNDERSVATGLNQGNAVDKQNK